MKRRLVQVPYHLGREDATLGTGPPLLAEAIGGETAVVDRGESFRNEVQASMAVVRALAAVVRDTLDGGYHPVVLAGNCNSALGTVTGAGEDLGVVWLDAHGDFETDETTTSGFFDGFALAMLTGQGWTAMRRGLTVVPPHRVVHVGGRDFNPGERERMVAAGATVVRDDAAEGSASSATGQAPSTSTSISTSSTRRRGSQTNTPLRAGSRRTSCVRSSSSSTRASRCGPSH